jgi:hypothetical protein
MFPGFVDTEMTRGLVATESGRHWQPYVVEQLRHGNSRAPEECAEATLRLLAVARPELNGCAFHVDSAIEDLAANAERIAAERKLTLRLVT